MNIAKLVARFRFYAENHVDIRHVQMVLGQQAFFHLEPEEVQAAVNGGIKFPCLLLQTPEAEKSGGFDHIMEGFSFTFVVLKPLLGFSKAQILEHCKTICDDIFNLMALEFVNEVLPGVVVSSVGGMAGPMAGQLYGWGVTIEIEDAYNAEVKMDKWLHLANGGMGS